MSNLKRIILEEVIKFRAGAAKNAAPKTLNESVNNTPKGPRIIFESDLDEPQEKKAPIKGGSKSIQYTGGKLHLNDYETETLPSIPVGNWIVMFHPQTGFYLQEMDDFVLPKKIYGDSEKLADKFLKTFEQRDKNLGILLSGLKGTGKSLLSRLICKKSNLPVLIIPASYNGVGFADFLRKVNQKVIIFMDEFEKVYGKHGSIEDQEGLLSILDGVFPSKFLFLLTINNLNKMESNLLNRPGRIFYHKNYEGLDEDVIREVLQDNLQDTGKIEEILRICQFLGEVSMDSVVSLIQECNMYPEQSPSELVKLMNLSPARVNYTMTVTKGGRPVGETRYDGSPLEDERFYKSFRSNIADKKGNKQWIDIEFPIKDAQVDVNKDRIKVNHGDFELVFTKIKPFKFSI